jgi:hypothetical protein
MEGAGLLPDGWLAAARTCMLARRLIFCAIMVSGACVGCQLFRQEKHWDPFPHEHPCGQLVIHSDTPLTGQRRLIEELVTQRDWINSQLGLTPSDRPIHVYLYGNEAEYYKFLNLRFPEMAARRAIFVGTSTDLTVYAHWGEQVAIDLRHEVAHGYLHATVPNIPLWLDEGLAEYFEVGRGLRGYNETHVEMLNRQLTTGTWRPELSRLEALQSAADMTQQDYAEAWAWVHYLLESEDDKAELLTSYLADLGSSAPAQSLSARVGKRLAAPRLALSEHIRTIR